MAARREITKKYAREYARAGKFEKGQLLDSLVATTGWTRDHARGDVSHDLVNELLNSWQTNYIARDKTAEAPRPRGWYIAAAARAIAEQPGLMVDWA